MKTTLSKTSFALFFAASAITGGLQAIPPISNTQNSIENTSSSTIQVEVTELKSNKGQVKISVFRNEDDFDNDSPYKSLYFSKKTSKDGKLLCKLNLPVGTYGIVVVDDENENKEMDFNFFGIPTEGFAFSDYYHTGLSRPKFTSFDFTAKEGAVSKVVAKMKYM